MDILSNYEEFKLPESFKKLVAFSLEYGNVSQDFYFEEEEDNSMYYTYTGNEEFVNQFITIGNADGTGSIYAFWARYGMDLRKAPIVVFGSEGGYHLVANDFDDLVRLLSYDCEPYIDWDEVYYYKDEDSYVSLNIDALHEWIKEELNLKSVKKEMTTKKIIQKANENHFDLFDEWVHQYLSDDYIMY